MKNILHDLYDGNFCAYERQPNRTEQSIATHRKIDDEKRYFMQKMSLDDCKRFEELECLYVQANDFEQKDVFAYGFRLATMLMCAVFVGDGDLGCSE